MVINVRPLIVLFMGYGVMGTDCYVNELIGYSIGG